VTQLIGIEPNPGPPEQAGFAHVTPTLEGFGFVEEGTSAQMYPALEEKAGQMPGDFETGLTRKTFNSVILGGNPKGW
jgi:hypothetical protein